MFIKGSEFHESIQALRKGQYCLLSCLQCWDPRVTETANVVAWPMLFVVPPGASVAPATGKKTTVKCALKVGHMSYFVQSERLEY